MISNKKYTMYTIIISSFFIISKTMDGDEHLFLEKYKILREIEQNEALCALVKPWMNADINNRGIFQTRILEEDESERFVYAAFGTYGITFSDENSEIAAFVSFERFNEIVDLLKEKEKKKKKRKCLVN